MTKERPSFKLHVDGKELWSLADIEPNWKYEAGPGATIMRNENARDYISDLELSNPGFDSERCGTCKFFVDGKCKISPIKKIRGSDPPRYSRAEVSEKNWCGEFERADNRVHTTR